MLSNILKGPYISAAITGSFLSFLTLWLICPEFRLISPYAQYPISIGVGLTSSMLGEYTAYRAHYSYSYLNDLERLAGIYAAAATSIFTAAARMIFPSIAAQDPARLSFTMCGATFAPTDVQLAAAAYIFAVFYNFFHFLRAKKRYKKYEQLQKQQPVHTIINPTNPHIFE